MAKRFTDTNKWRKDFIRGLQAPYKLLWLYILDECDHAGIWHVELDVAGLRIGYELKEEEIIKAFNGHIIIFDKGHKWLIPDFIEFQYGILNSENRAHNSVLELLEKYKLKGHLRGLQGRKDKDKDKELDKVKDKEEVPFEKFWNLYDKKEDRIKCERKWNNLTNKERENCITNLPAYILSTPDKQFRKNPSTYLNNKSWENEIIKPVDKVKIVLTYDEILKASEKDPDIWNRYKAVKRDGERKAIFEPIL